MLKRNGLLNNWFEINPKAFKFKSDAITLHEANQTFDIKELTPLEVYIDYIVIIMHGYDVLYHQVDKDEVDQCQPNSSAIPHMHVEAKLMKDYTLTDLKFEFKGTVKKLFFVITEVELSTSK